MSDFARIVPSPALGSVPAVGLMRGDVIDGGRYGHLRRVERVEPKAETVVVTFADGWSVEYPHEQSITLETP